MLIKATAEQCFTQVEGVATFEKGVRNQEMAFTYPLEGGGSVLINVNGLMMLHADKFCRRKTHFACRPRTKKERNLQADEFHDIHSLLHIRSQLLGVGRTELLHERSALH